MLWPCLTTTAAGRRLRSPGAPRPIAGLLLLLLFSLVAFSAIGPLTARGQEDLTNPPDVEPTTVLQVDVTNDGDDDNEVNIHVEFAGHDAGDGVTDDVWIITYEEDSWQGSLYEFSDETVEVNTPLVDTNWERSLADLTHEDAGVFEPPGSAIVEDVVPTPSDAIPTPEVDIVLELTSDDEVGPTDPGTTDVPQEVEVLVEEVEEVPQPPVEFVEAAATPAQPTPQKAAVPLRVRLDMLHVGNETGRSEELQRVLSVMERAGKPASRDVLSEQYYTALEALYLHHNISEFAERVERGVAETGHSRLHFLLGVLYTNGLGVVRSEAKAVLHYTFAAIQGVPEAHVALGHRHRYGLGVPRDCASAVMHLREAADAVAMTHDGRINPRPIEQRARVVGGGLVFSTAGSSDPFSLSERDRAQRETTQTQRNLDAARFQVEQGYAEAALRLGVSYLHGVKGVRRDTRLAERYFLQAIRLREGRAREPLYDAYAYLGQLYAMGDPQAQPDPIPRDLERAVDYFRKGAAGDTSGLAMNGLGYLHVVGYLQQDKTPQERRRARDAARGPASPPSGVDDTVEQNEEEDRTPDYTTATNYFVRARELGCAEGMYNLGVLLLHGIGRAAPDTKRAQDVFEQAAVAGSMLSLWQLGLLAEARGDCPRAVDYFALVTRYGSWNDHSISTDSTVTRGGGRPNNKHPSSRDDNDGADDDLAQDDVEYLGLDAAAKGEQQQQQSHRRKTLAALKSAVMEAVRHSDGRASVFSSSKDDEADIARLVEHLALAETGNVAAARKAAVLVDEELLVADEEESDEALAMARVVEAGNPSFAYDNALPPEVPEWAAADTIVLQWRLPTSVAFTQGGTGASRRTEGDGSANGRSSVYTVPWLVSQREAKRLLLLRLLYLSASQSTASCLRLGDFYYYGESPLIGSDAVAALQYYKEATQDNTAQAYFNVGLMHQLGIGVPPLRVLSEKEEAEAEAEDGSMSRMSPSKRHALRLNASVARALSSPLMRAWRPGLAASPELARQHEWRTTAPNYILQAVLRLLESVVHNRAPANRVWRYEGGKLPPNIDLVAAITPAPDAGSLFSLTGSSDDAYPARLPSQPFYYYDLNLAKRAYDDCLLYSFGSAYHAVHIARVLLNLQWWALYFGRPALRGLIAYAAEQLSVSERGVDGPLAQSTSSAARLLRLGKVLVQGATTQLVNAMTGAGVVLDEPENGDLLSTPPSSRSRPTIRSSGLLVNKAKVAGAEEDDGDGRTLWALLSAMGAWYVMLETYLLFLLCGVLFTALVLQHHVA